VSSGDLALMGDNPRRYGFNESLDELPAMVHHSARGRLTKCQPDPALVRW
jgi:hypothetical protein